MSRSPKYITEVLLETLIPLGEWKLTVIVLKVKNLALFSMVLRGKVLATCHTSWALSLYKNLLSWCSSSQFSFLFFLFS